MRRSVQGLTAWLIAACGTAPLGLVSAQDSSFAAVTRDPAESDSGAALRTAERSAAAGVFLRLAESPTTSTHQVAVGTYGGYDGSRQGALFETRGEVVLMSRAGLERRSVLGLSLVGGGAYAAGAPGLSELRSRAEEPRASTTTSARVGIKLQPFFQEQLGLDVALSVTYESRGFNLVPAVATDLLLGRRIGEAQLLFNAGVGAGLRESECSGRVRAAILVPLLGQLRVGLEARGQLDLERDQDEPNGETDYEFAGSAVANYSISHFSLTAGAGPGAIRYRNGQATEVGVVATIGIGAAL